MTRRLDELTGSRLDQDRTEEMGVQYSGGKEKIAAGVAAVLQPYVDASGAYCEPFLGGASVFARIRAPIKYGSDANPWLMHMWQAVFSW